MAQETFFDKVRDFIGGIAWAVFLWSIKMTEDEYLDSVVRESGLTQRAPDVCNASDCEEPAVIAGLCEKHSF